MDSMTPETIMANAITADTIRANVITAPPVPISPEDIRRAVITVDRFLGGGSAQS